ncbi:MAG: hypothetical protein ABIF82_12195 [Planctomycetota bacterium]
MKDGQHFGEDGGGPHRPKPGDGLKQRLLVGQERADPPVELVDLIDEKVDPFDDKADLQREGLGCCW